MVVLIFLSTHDANANKGQRPRLVQSVRRMPATIEYRHDNAVNRGFRGYGHDTRPLMLVRGRDRCGKNDFQCARPERALAS